MFDQFICSICYSAVLGTRSALYAVEQVMKADGYTVIGPIAGGWIAETRLGWRFNFWIMFIFSVLTWTFGFLAMRETVRTLPIPGYVFAISPFR